MFSHPARISVDRALAVHAVLHNRANPETWETLDKWVGEVGQLRVIDDIVEIMKMNRWSGFNTEEVVAAERKWWANHLRYARCSCGLGYSKEAFEQLPAAAGGLRYEDEVEVLEFRNCTCHSTIAVVIEVKQR